MHASEVTPEVIERANELYWGSDASVNRIAADLELSKGALYGVIEPERTGFGCPLCGEEVAYPNRTAKERGRLDCPTCDWDGNTDETTSYDPSPSSGEGDGTDADLPAVLPPRPLMTPRSRTIAGGALLGAAVGLALVLWARRR
jgi:predicted RNA-binding Zn-ribbon protein involved in translation (DUF1610 family)